jgi:O-antigen/teichoic acid export membrane protein
MPVRKVLRAFAGLAGAMLVTQVVGFVALAVAARRLGPEALGAATFVLSVVTYCGLLANFGVGILAVRDIARDPGRAADIAGEVIALRAVLLAGMAAVLVVGAPWIAADDATRVLLPVATLVIVLEAISGEWTLLGLQRSAPVALARLTGQLAYGALVVLTLGGGLDGAREFVLYTALSVFITVAMTQAVAWRVTGRPRVHFRRSVLRRRLIEGAPLGLAVLAIQGYLAIGSVLLGYLKGIAEVGQYGVAQKIPLALFGIVNLWSATIFPQATRLIAEDPERLRRQVGAFLSLNLAVAFPLGVGGTFTGEDLIPRLFGDAYEPAGTAFILLMWGLALSVPTATIGGVLAATGHERRYAAGVAIGALASVAVSLVTIPRYGAPGAAGATIVAETAILVLLTRRYRRVIGPIEFDARRIGRMACAALVLAVALLALPDDLDVLVRIPLGAAVYAGALLGLGAVRPSEIGLRRPTPE